MIIDVHCHLGIDRVFGGETTEEDVVRMVAENGIDKAIVQPNFAYPTLEHQKADHDRIDRFIKQQPEKKFFGMVSLNPHIEPEIYYEEASRCIKKLGFIGIKLHPIAHGCDPLMQDGEIPFKVAYELGVPLMIHTGFGSPIADPSHIMPRAKQYPNLNIVMSHLGIADKIADALMVMKECSNVYGDLSLLASFLVPMVVQEVGAKRLMFGSDVNPDCPMELAKIRHAVKNSEDLDCIFSKTAQEVYPF